jgi:hypothetical protein
MAATHQIQKEFGTAVEHKYSSPFPHNYISGVEGLSDVKFTCVSTEARFSAPDRTRGLPSLLYNGYRSAFPGIKRRRRGVDHTSPSSAEVKERVQLYTSIPLHAFTAHYRMKFNISYFSCTKYFKVTTIFYNSQAKSVRRFYTTFRCQ